MTASFTAKKHPILTSWHVQKLQYVTIQKAMLRCAVQFGITSDDALLYALLRSRCDLSYENGWVDKSGRIFVIFTYAQAAELMGYTRKTAIAAFRRLCDAGFIEMENQFADNGMKKAAHIFVKQWISPPVDETGAFLYQGFTPEDVRGGALPYLTEQNIDVQPGKYFSIPRLLLEHPCYKGLPIKAKLLYVVALDELHKSIRFGKLDEKGLPYCHLDRDQVMEYLQCGDRTVTTLYGALKKIGLLETRKTGISSKERVYLRDFSISEEEDAEWLESPENNESAKITPPARNNYTSCPQDLHHQSADLTPPTRKKDTAAPQDLHPSNRSPVNEDSYRSEESIPPAQRTGDSPDAIIRENPILEEKLDCAGILSDLDILLGNTGQNRNSKYILKLCIDAILWAEEAEGRELRIGNAVYPVEEVRSLYRAVERDTLLTLVWKVGAHMSGISNIRSYVRQSMLTAAEDHAGESYYLRREIEALRAAKDGTKE